MTRSRPSRSMYGLSGFTWAELFAFLASSLVGAALLVWWLL